MSLVKPYFLSKKEKKKKVEVSTWMSTKCSLDHNVLSLNPIGGKIKILSI